MCLIKRFCLKFQLSNLFVLYISVTLPRLQNGCGAPRAKQPAARRDHGHRVHRHRRWPPFCLPCSAQPPWDAGRSCSYGDGGAGDSDSVHNHIVTLYSRAENSGHDHLHQHGLYPLQWDWEHGHTAPLDPFQLRCNDSPAHHHPCCPQTQQQPPGHRQPAKALHSSCPACQSPAHPQQDGVLSGLRGQASCVKAGRSEASGYHSWKARATYCFGTAPLGHQSWYCTEHHRGWQRAAAAVQGGDHRGPHRPETNGRGPSSQHCQSVGGHLTNNPAGSAAQNCPGELSAMNHKGLVRQLSGDDMSFNTQKCRGRFG